MRLVHLYGFSCLEGPSTWFNALLLPSWNPYKLSSRSSSFSFFTESYKFCSLFRIKNGNHSVIFLILTNSYSVTDVVLGVYLNQSLTWKWRVFNWDSSEQSCCPRESGRVLTRLVGFASRAIGLIGWKDIGKVWLFHIISVTIREFQAFIPLLVKSQLSYASPFGEGKGNPLQYFCLENPMDRGAWWTTIVHGVTKSWIWLSN